MKKKTIEVLEVGKTMLINEECWNNLHQSVKVQMPHCDRNPEITKDILEAITERLKNPNCL